MKLPAKYPYKYMIAKIYAEWQNKAKLYTVQPSFSPSLGENDGKFISTWNFGIFFFVEINHEKEFFTRFDHILIDGVCSRFRSKNDIGNN